MMTSETKIRKANMQFASSGTWMTPEAKFREPNLYFMSLKTEMTQRDKFDNGIKNISSRLLITSPIKKIVLLVMEGAPANYQFHC